MSTQSTTLICLWLITVAGSTSGGLAASDLNVLTATETHYTEGLHFYRSDDYEAAVGSFQTAIKLDPSFVPAYRQLVAVHRDSSRLDRAIEFFNSLTRDEAQRGYVHYGLGLAHQASGDYESAIESFTRSIEEAIDHADAYAQLVNSYSTAGKLDDALRYMEKLTESNPDNPLPYLGLGYVYAMRSEPATALDIYDKALVLDPTLLEAYFYKVQSYFNSSQYTKAIETGLHLLRSGELGIDYLVRSRAMSSVGASYMRLGDLPTASAYLDSAIELARHSNEKAQEGAALGNRGTVYAAHGQFDQALECFLGAADIAVDIGNKGLEVSWRGNIGMIYALRGDYRSGMEQLESAIQTAREIGHKQAICTHSGNLASMYAHLGDYRTALTHHEDAAELAREIGDRMVEARMLTNIGADHCRLGNYGKAVVFFEKAVSLGTEIGDRELVGRTLTNIGTTYSDMRDFGRALERFERALAISREIGDRKGEALSLENIGFCHESLTEFDGALSSYVAAHKIFQEIGDTRNEALTLGDIGNVYFSKEEYAKARRYIREAMEASESIGFKFGIGVQSNNLGDLACSTHDTLTAEIAYARAREVGGEIGVPLIVWRAEAGLGRVHEQVGDYDTALDHYMAAVQSIEQVRSAIAMEDLKATFFEAKRNVYVDLINLLFECHQRDPLRGFDREAFHYAERAKARSLLDVLSESEVDIREGVDGILLDREGDVLRKLTAIQTELRASGLEDSLLAALKEELACQEEMLSQIRVEITRSSPAYASIKYPEPLNLSQAQERIVSPGEAILEYALGDDHSYLWLITKTESEFHRLPSAQEIESEVEKYLALISKPPQPGLSSVPLGKNLYDKLIGPVADCLQPDFDVLIVPDGKLHYLPFETLVSRIDGELPEYLVEHVDLSYAPSVSALASLLDMPESRSEGEKLELFAMGDPVFGEEDVTAVDGEFSERSLYEGHGFEFKRLPYTEDEVVKVSALYPDDARRIFVRGAALEEQVKGEDLTRYRKLHFATHGLVDELVPGRSCIVLTLDEDPAEDGFLQMREIFNLELDADLVVLSACQTGRGRLIRGEGLIGLSRAFFYAGARSLLVSLWSVNDKSTAGFMEQFYRSLNEGSTKAAALRLAKLSMIKGNAPALRHPYYWAPFVLIGDSE